MGRNRNTFAWFHEKIGNFHITFSEYEVLVQIPLVCPKNPQLKFGLIYFPNQRTVINFEKAFAIYDQSIIVWQKGDSYPDKYLKTIDDGINTYYYSAEKMNYIVKDNANEKYKYYLSNDVVWYYDKNNNYQFPYAIKDLKNRNNNLDIAKVNGNFLISSKNETIEIVCDFDKIIKINWKYIAENHKIIDCSEIHLTYLNSSLCDIIHYEKGKIISQNSIIHRDDGMIFIDHDTNFRAQLIMIDSYLKSYKTGFGEAFENEEETVFKNSWNIVKNGHNINYNRGMQIIDKRTIRYRQFDDWKLLYESSLIPFSHEDAQKFSLIKDGFMKDVTTSFKNNNGNVPAIVNIDSEAFGKINAIKLDKNQLSVSKEIAYTGKKDDFFTFLVWKQNNELNIKLTLLSKGEEINSEEYYITKNYDDITFAEIKALGNFDTIEVKISTKEIHVNYISGMVLYNKGFIRQYEYNSNDYLVSVTENGNKQEIYYPEKLQKPMNYISYGTLNISSFYDEKYYYVTESGIMVDKYTDSEGFNYEMRGDGTYYMSEKTYLEDNFYTEINNGEATIYSLYSDKISKIEYPDNSNVLFDYLDYDQIKRITYKMDNQIEEINYQYDNKLLKKAISKDNLGKQNIFEFFYDEANRVNAVTENGVSIGKIDYNYLLKGYLDRRVIKKDFFNGDSYYYIYDNKNRIEKIIYRNNTSEKLLSSFAYNSNTATCLNMSENLKKEWETDILGRQVLLKGDNLYVKNHYDNNFFVKETNVLGDKYFEDFEENISEITAWDMQKKFINNNDFYVTFFQGLNPCLYNMEKKLLPIPEYKVEVKKEKKYYYTAETNYVLSSSSERTIAFWVLLDSLQQNENSILLNINSTSEERIIIYYKESKWLIEVNNVVGNLGDVKSNWNFFCITYKMEKNNNSLNVYINGSLAYRPAVFSPTSLNDQIYLGSNGLSKKIKGKFGAVFVSDKVAYADTILELYNKSKKYFDSNKSSYLNTYLLKNNYTGIDDLTRKGELFPLHTSTSGINGTKASFFEGEFAYVEEKRRYLFADCDLKLLYEFKEAKAIIFSVRVFDSPSDRVLLGIKGQNGNAVNIYYSTGMLYINNKTYKLECYLNDWNIIIVSFPKANQIKLQVAEKTIMFEDSNLNLYSLLEMTLGAKNDFSNPIRAYYEMLYVQGYYSEDYSEIKASLSSIFSTYQKHDHFGL